MREILFRGKLHSGEWSYGNLSVKTNGVEIITPDDTPIGKYGLVAPKTVGQSTGLNDKNGKKVFEGDICLCDRNIASSVDKQLFVIVYDTENGAWAGVGEYSDINATQSSLCEVVGNIHDNPELVGKRADTSQSR